MRSISLLPPEIKAQRQARVRRTNYVKRVGIVFLVLLMVYTGAGLATLHARSRVASLQDRRALLEKEIAGFREYVAMEDRISVLDKLIKQAVGGSPDWASLLADINRNMPPGVWLTDFSGSSGARSKKAEAGKVGQEPAARTASPQAGSGQGPKPAGAQGELVIRGWTFDQPSLALWLEELRGVSGLSEVRLQFASRETVEGRSMIKFEIKAGVQAQPSPKPAPERGGQ